MRGLLLRGLLLVGVLIALTLFINLSWFDESLLPEIEALAEPQPVSMDGNAFPLVYGLPAASDRNPRDAGLAIVQALRERYRRGESVTLSDEEMAAILGAAEADGEDWRDSFPGLACASRDQTGCADVLIADVARADRHARRLDVLLDRYEAILQQPRFEENQEFDVSTPIPDYGQLMAVSRVRLAGSFRRKPTAAFLTDLSRDLEFWKLMLRDGQSLIAKMVALAGIRNNLTFISTLLRERDLSDGELESIAQIVTPLTEQERDIGETFLHELRIGLLSRKVLAVMQSTPLLDRLILQENATLNEAYGMWTLPLRLRASFSADEFWRQRGYEPLRYSVRAFPPPLYNLGGKLGLKRQAAELGAQDYITRVHNLDGRIALALLHAEIVANSDKGTENVVSSSVHRNPYTLEPMDYDAATRTIGFDCLTERTGEICAVVVDGRLP